MLTHLHWNRLYIELVVLRMRLDRVNQGESALSWVLAEVDLHNLNLEQQLVLNPQFRHEGVIEVDFHLAVRPQQEAFLDALQLQVDGVFENPENPDRVVLEGVFEVEAVRNLRELLMVSLK